MKYLFILLLIPCLSSAQVSPPPSVGIVNATTVNFTGELDAISAKIKSKNLDLKGLMDQVASLGKQRKALSDAMNQKKSELDKLDKDASGYNDRAAAIKKEIGKLQSQVDAIDKQLSLINESIDKLQKEIDQLQQAMKSKADELTARAYANARKEADKNPSVKDSLSQRDKALLALLDNKYRNESQFKVVVNREQKILQDAEKKESTADNTKESAEAARDRKKAALDNLQKLLDIIRSMNPQI